VRLWDSRFDCEGEDNGDKGAGMPAPRTHLATFKCFKRWIHSIEVIDEGSYVRPTDDIDMAMASAVIKKAALEGAAAVQRAARQREIIKCSGSFVTASQNDKDVSVWEMDIAEKGEGGEKTREDNVATLSLAHVLEHDSAVTALAATRTRIFAGDVTGVVVLWERKEGLLSWARGGGTWTKLHQFPPWKRALASPTEKLEQSIVGLCALGEGTFVTGGKSGTVRVWDNFGTAKGYMVLKKGHANSVKFTSGTLTGIQKLPHAKNPNTGKECQAFAVASTDGRMACMALHPQESSTKNDLVMFHEHGPLPIAIESIAVCEVNDSPLPVLVVGDGNGDINLVEPEWTAKTGV